MGQFTVEGIGTFPIEGDMPNAAEQEGIDTIVKEYGGAILPTAPAQPDANGVPAPAPAVPPTAPNLTPILTPEPRPVPPQQGIMRATNGYANRDAFTMTGALAGGAIAAGAGQIPPLTVMPEEALTMPVGEALGAGAGSLSYDIMDSFARGFYGEPPAYDPADPLGPTKQAGKEMGMDIAGSGVARSLGNLARGGKKLIGKFLGVENPVSKELAELSRTYDVPMGITQGSDSGLVKGVGRVMGVIPFVGGPFKNQSKKVDLALSGMTDDILDAMAPRARMTDLGVDFTKAAGEKFEKFNRISAGLYDRVLQLARSLPADRQAIIPTKNLKEAANTIIDQYKRGLVVRPTGDMEEEVLKKSPLLRWAEEIQQYPGLLTMDQFKGKTEALREMMNVAGKQGYGLEHGVALKKALEADLNSPFLNFAGKQGPEIQKALAQANKYYNSAAKTFETPTAKKFGRVDKNIFGSGYVDNGMTNADELLPTLLKTSNQGLQDLRSIVGPAKFREAGRVLLQNAFEKSYKPGKDASKLLFEPARFAKNVGLDTPEGKQRLATVLEGTGMEVRHLEDFVKMLDSNRSFFSPDTSVFLQRRVTLGGVGSLWAAGKVGQKSVLGGLISLAAMRKGAKMLSSAENFQILTKAFDDSAPVRDRRRAVVRLVRELGDSDPLMAGDAKRWEEQLLSWEKKAPPSDPVSDIQRAILEARPELKKTIQKAIGMGD